MNVSSDTAQRSPNSWWWLFLITFHRLDLAIPIEVRPSFLLPALLLPDVSFFPRSKRAIEAVGVLRCVPGQWWPRTLEKQRLCELLLLVLLQKCEERDAVSLKQCGLQQVDCHR